MPEKKEWHMREELRERLEGGGSDPRCVLIGIEGMCGIWGTDIAL